MMAGLRMALVAALGTTVLVVGACDNGPSAVQREARQAAGTQMATAPPDRGAEAPRADRRDEPVKLVDGKPMWSASRRYSAEESAQRAFERNGEAFGARNLDQYVRKAHAFVEHPPAGTETLTRRNGDTLFYNAKSNVFAVANKEGAPRTMFKPDEGAAYWQKQKDSLARQTARRSRADNGDDA